MHPTAKRDLIESLNSALRILNRETQDTQQWMTVASLCNQVAAEANQEVGKLRAMPVICEKKLEKLSQYIFEENGSPSNWLGFSFEGARKILVEDSAPTQPLLSGSFKLPSGLVINWDHIDDVRKFPMGINVYGTMSRDGCCMNIADKEWEPK